jgi:hypothetical protein
LARAGVGVQGRKISQLYYNLTLRTIRNLNR